VCDSIGIYDGILFIYIYIYRALTKKYIYTNTKTTQNRRNQRSRNLVRGDSNTRCTQTNTVRVPATIIHWSTELSQIQLRKATASRVRPLPSRRSGTRTLFRTDLVCTRRAIETVRHCWWAPTRDRPDGGRLPSVCACIARTSLFSPSSSARPTSCPTSTSPRRPRRSPSSRAQPVRFSVTRRYHATAFPDGSAVGIAVRPPRHNSRKRIFASRDVHDDHRRLPRPSASVSLRVALLFRTKSSSGHCCRPRPSQAAPRPRRSFSDFRAFSFSRPLSPRSSSFLSLFRYLTSTIFWTNNNECASSAVTISICITPSKLYSRQL